MTFIQYYFVHPDFLQKMDFITYSKSHLGNKYVTNLLPVFLLYYFTELLLKSSLFIKAIVQIYNLYIWLYR